MPAHHRRPGIVTSSPYRPEPTTEHQAKPAKRNKGPVELCGASPLREQSLDALARVFDRLLQRLS